MSWLWDHLVLTAAILLVALVVVGLVVLAIRGLVLWKATKSVRGEIDPRVATLTSSVDQAQRRVDGLTRAQGDLTDTIARVQASTGELGRLVSTAGRAVSVLRAPLKYLGR